MLADVKRLTRIATSATLPRIRKFRETRIDVRSPCSQADSLRSGLKAIYRVSAGRRGQSCMQISLAVLILTSCKTFRAFPFHFHAPITSITWE